MVPRVVIAAGGTAGHVVPALAVADALRAEGAEVTFRCEELDLDFPVFTTRPDTLFGATFFVLAPEHPEVEKLAEGTGNEAAVRDYVNESARASAD